MRHPQKRVVIIGGGVSGLATAYFLSRAGIRSLILEKSDRLGGLIKTDIVGGCQLEAGPDSYIAAKPAVTQLAAQLGDLENQIIGSNDEARRVFIVQAGRLVPLPRGMAMMVPGEWAPVLKSELFSAKTKLRFVKETVLPPRRRDDDVSVAAFITDHFGREVLGTVAGPLLSGVYGGDSEQLSAESVLPRFLEYERRYGSLVRGVRKERRSERSGSLFLSFREGMQALTDSLSVAIQDDTEILYEEATELQRVGNGWLVKTCGHEISTAQVVLASPAHVSARLLDKSAGQLASELAGIPYASSILVTMVYQADQLQRSLDGFGFLVPSAERRTVAAVTWVSTKFPSRVPSHLVALRAFVVEPEAKNLLDSPSAEVVQLVRTDIERLMSLGQQPVFSKVQRWPNSMPQYIIGHKRRQERIRQLLGELPGLYLCGNAYDGIGIPDCVRIAEETASSIKHFCE